jgi:hypothetical protein
MAFVRPRLTDFHGISAAQADLDFAIPFLEEDIPLYVDPFLLWRSPSQQDNALHTSLVHSFNHQNWLLQKNRDKEAIQNLIIASECDEVGLGESPIRKGKRIGEATAREILDLFRRIPKYGSSGFAHFEEIQLYVDGISRDRVSDITCSFLKSFLIDFTIEQCLKVGIPLAQRWLRFVPWINFDDYFATACPKDDIVNKQGSDERVRVLLYNRENWTSRRLR